MKKKKTNVGLFVAVFVIIIGLTIVNNIIRDDVTTLTVPNNPGVSGLETVSDTLVCTYQDGRIVTWDWQSYKQVGNFKAVSDRMVILDPQHIAAVNASGKKRLTVYSLPAGQKQSELSVGWEDQNVWLRISPDKKIIALIRQNPPDAQQNTLYEFLSVDIEKEVLSLPAALSIPQTAEFVDYASDDNGILYAVGSNDNAGRIAALNLDKGAVLWDTVYPDTDEFCSILADPQSASVYAGNRNGFLYKLDAKTGQITKKIQLLEAGETRPITNDYSVLSPAFSPDGRYYVATINPKAYILKSGSDEIIHTCVPADRLVSKITFSPDNHFFATSDIRAGYPVKIWPMPQEK